MPKKESKKSARKKKAQKPKVLPPKKKRNYRKRDKKFWKNHPRKKKRYHGKGGRKPYKLDDKRIETILASLRNGATMTAACYTANISRAAFYAAMERSSALRKAVERTDGIKTVIVEDSLLTSCVRGNVVAQKYWLNNRKSRRWKEKTEASVSVVGTAPIIVQYAPPRPPKKKD